MNKCPRCDGCGQIADTDDREPWTAWTSLPAASRVAVTVGLVKPIPCDMCQGMHPLNQAIRDYVDRLTCIEEEGCVKTGAAVLAVLDRHPAYRTGLHPEAPWACRTCDGGECRYPCPTVKVIADALDVET